MLRLGPFLAFLAVALTLVGGMHYYAWARLVRDPQLPPLLSRLLAFALVVLALSLVAAPILSRVLRGDALRPLYFAAFLWMGVGFLTVGLLGAVDFGRLVVAGVLKVAALLQQAGAGGAADPQRRVFLARAVAGGVGVAAAGLSAAGLRAAMGSIQVKQVPVRVPRLPQALAGLRVVQISDVHIGALLRKDWLDGVVDRIEALKPDLVAITGDLVDGSVRELAQHVAPLGRLQKLARLGVYFVTGNHEYYAGAESWLSHLPTLGIRPLRNERVRLAEGLEIAGIPDASARSLGAPHAPDLDLALQGRDPKGALILLAHQPRQFLEAAAKDVQLTLSGHTHGGQIWPASWLVYLAQPYVAGLHRRGDAQIYVSRGTGFWGPPLRVGAPAEITLLELHPAPAAQA
jgi:predicted MPP superfamily phosphohydrolase